MGMRSVAYTLGAAASLLLVGGIVWSATGTHQSATQSNDFSTTSAIYTNPTILIPALGLRLEQRASTKKYAATSTYKSSGFTPSIIRIKAGEAVRFVNASNSGMRIKHLGDGETAYLELDQQMVVGRGGTFDFLFNKPGTWAYYNLVGDKSVSGTIIVDPQ